MLGGDQRQIYAAHEILKNTQNVTTYGLKSDSKIKESEFLSFAMKNADLIILPLPFSTDNTRLFCPLCDKYILLNEIIENVENGMIVSGGKLSDWFVEKLKEKGAIPFDYYKSERFAIHNAIPTAEGALAIAMNELKTTINGAKCAVLGYGRIGKILAKTLKKLDADVTVYARKDEVLAWAEAEGCNTDKFEDICKNIGKNAIIFNTVPSLVLTSETLDCTDENVVIIDLASTPGGVDNEYAKLIGRKVIFALSLPGKVAPITAGKIIADTVLSYYKGVAL
ncbi:MAG: dipicolinate synthase subunit DpsA [Clostridia bacterium]|nr:dipicolinate synthase subunit DpsA [Clostridia bacterium]